MEEALIEKKQNEAKRITDVVLFHQIETRNKHQTLMQPIQIELGSMLNQTATQQPTSNQYR